jgi:hypothetical protein
LVIGSPLPAPAAGPSGKLPETAGAVEWTFTQGVREAAQVAFVPSSVGVWMPVDNAFITFIAVCMICLVVAISAALHT